MAETGERQRLVAAERFGVSPRTFDGAPTTEAHQHFDPDGNLTGTTLVTRESDFDDYTRSRIFALMAAESRQCPKCHNFDSLVPLTDDPVGDKNWVVLDGHMFAVGQFRCVACGLSDLVERDFRRSVERFEPSTGQASPMDGRMFVVRSISKPPSQSEEVT